MSVKDVISKSRWIEGNQGPEVYRKREEWDHWSEKFIALTRARGFAGILLGTEQAPNADEDIDRKKNDGGYELTEAERKVKKRLREANGNANIN